MQILKMHMNGRRRQVDAIEQNFAKRAIIQRELLKTNITLGIQSPKWFFVLSLANKNYELFLDLFRRYGDHRQAEVSSQNNNLW